MKKIKVDELEGLTYSVCSDSLNIRESVKQESTLCLNPSPSNWLNAAC